MDFGKSCRVAVQDCFASLSTFATRIDQVARAVSAKHGIKVEHVVVMGDEEDPKWWQDVKDRGWKVVDHAAEKTVEKHGIWYPTIIDVRSFHFFSAFSLY